MPAHRGWPWAGLAQHPSPIGPLAALSLDTRWRGQRRKRTGLGRGQPPHLTPAASCAPRLLLEPSLPGAGSACEAAALAGPSWAACTLPAASGNGALVLLSVGLTQLPGPQVWASFRKARSGERACSEQGSAVCSTRQPWGGGGRAMPGAQVGTRARAPCPAVHMGGPPGQAVLTSTRGQRRAGRGPQLCPL